MKRRADLGYGMSPQKNAAICSMSEEFTALVPFWNWMAFMQQEAKVKHQGALSLLSQQQEPSEMLASAVLPLPTYSSVARAIVLDIIGWSNSALSVAVADGGSVGAVLTVNADSGEFPFALLDFSPASRSDHPPRFPSFFSLR
jgi:hypothetical protein